jgi:hypothetical protein
MKSPRFTPILSTLVSLVFVGGLGLLGLLLVTDTCGDDRPPLDDKVGVHAERLGEAKESPGSGHELRAARQRFITSSQAQLAVLAAEVERRGVDPNAPIERIESLRRDYWTLVELRRKVLDSSDEQFDDVLSLFETQVDTIREQLARLDRGQLP